MKQQRFNLTSLGAWYPVLTFFARLPFSMLVVGTLTMVVAVRDAVDLGGLAAAALGIANSVCAPFFGSVADRYGQRIVLLSLTLTNVAAMLLLIATTVGGAPWYLVAATAALVGATIPLVSPFSRSRCNAFVVQNAAPAEVSAQRTRLFAQESTLDEISFVAGPFLVGVISLLISPVAAIYVAAAWTLLGSLVFLAHPSAALTAAPQREAQAVAASQPLSLRRTLTAKPIALLVLLHLTIGSIFGATLTSLTAILAAADNANSSGIWYGLLGCSSAAMALATAKFSPRFTPVARLIVFSAVALLGTVVYAVAHANPVLLGLGLLGLGVGMGPVLVTGFALGAERSPQGRTTTVITQLTAAITLGQATTAAVTGQLAGQLGFATAALVPTVASVLMLLLAAQNRRV